MTKEIAPVTQKDLYLQIKEWAVAQGFNIQLCDEGEEYEMFCIEAPHQDVMDAFKEQVMELVGKYPNTLDLDEEGDVSFCEEDGVGTYLIIYPSRYSSDSKNLSVYSW